MIISSSFKDKVGCFIFPESILIEKGIINTILSPGKRGMRVYPPWEEAVNKQAQKTQEWQRRYFFEIEKKPSSNLANIVDFFKGMQNI